MFRGSKNTAVLAPRSIDYKQSLPSIYDNNNNNNNNSIEIVKERPRSNSSMSFLESSGRSGGFNSVTDNHKLAKNAGRRKFKDHTASLKKMSEEMMKLDQLELSPRQFQAPKITFSTPTHHRLSSSHNRTFNEYSNSNNNTSTQQQANEGDDEEQVEKEKEEMEGKTGELETGHTDEEGKRKKRREHEDDLDEELSPVELDGAQSEMEQDVKKKPTAHLGDRMNELVSGLDEVKGNLDHSVTELNISSAHMHAQVNTILKHATDGFVESMIAEIHHLSMNEIPEVYLRSIPKFGMGAEENVELHKTLVALKTSAQNVSFPSSLIEKIKLEIREIFERKFENFTVELSNMSNMLNNYYLNITKNSEKLEEMMFEIKTEVLLLLERLENGERVNQDLREELESERMHMRQKEVMMDILKEQVNRRNDLLDEQRTSFHRELLSLKMALLEKRNSNCITLNGTGTGTTVSSSLNNANLLNISVNSSRRMSVMNNGSNSSNNSNNNGSNGTNGNSSSGNALSNSGNNLLHDSFYFASSSSSSGFELSAQMKQSQKIMEEKLEKHVEELKKSFLREKRNLITEKKIALEDKDLHQLLPLLQEIIINDLKRKIRRLEDQLGLPHSNLENSQTSPSNNRFSKSALPFIHL